MSEQTENQAPKVCGVMQVHHKRGIMYPQKMTPPGLARAMCEAMEAAGVIDEQILNWVADPEKRTITFMVPGGVS